MDEAKLIVFAKAPRSGVVKTRLAATLGEPAARAAYQQLVATVLQQMAPFHNVELRFSPDDAESDVRPWLRKGWEMTGQGNGDLGDRLDRAFQSAFANGAGRVVIIGSDCPEVTPADIEAAWTALLSQDVVLGPAFDGGYWLIGLRRAQPGLFAEIPWSTSAVLQETIKRSLAAGLTVRLLRELPDIDTEADWLQFLGRTGAAGAA
jgi:rSAM/selenodomain-associated transferase 1